MVVNIDDVMFESGAAAAVACLYAFFALTFLSQSHTTVHILGGVKNIICINRLLDSGIVPPFRFIYTHFLFL